MPEFLGIGNGAGQFPGTKGKEPARWRLQWKKSQDQEKEEDFPEDEVGHNAWGCAKLREEWDLVSNFHCHSGPWNPAK